MIRPELEGNIIWNPKKKIEVNPIYLKTNFDVKNGYEYIIKKAIRGDSSDNIEGIKGTRSTKIKLIIEAMKENYDFDSLRASGLLSEEHINVLYRNLEVMRLDKLLECRDEMAYYEKQMCVEPKIDKERFRTYMKNMQFLEVLKRFDSWFKALSLDKVRTNKKIDEGYVDLFEF